MDIIPIKTRKILPPEDDLFAVLDESIESLEEKDLIFISSKVLSIHQGRCILSKDIKDKEKLIEDESESVLRAECQKGITVGIKHAIINPFGGIDESNGNGYTILQPTEPSVFAGKIHKYLRNKFDIKQVGVVIVDSAFLPMRTGSVSMSIGSYGLSVLRDCREHADVFANVLKMSQANVVDSLSAIAGLYLGEADEQTPVVILRGLRGIDFTEGSQHDKLTELPFGDSFCAFYDLFKKNEEK